MDDSKRKGLRDEDLPVRREIELLTTIKETNPSSNLASKSFGNIIELGIKSLILESARELEVGTHLTLDVVFPGQPRGDYPFSHLQCVIRKAHDNPILHYDLEIVEVNPSSRARLEIYLQQPTRLRGR